LERCKKDLFIYIDTLVNGTPHELPEGRTFEVALIPVFQHILDDPDISREDLLIGLFDKTLLYVRWLGNPNISYIPKELAKGSDELKSFNQYFRNSLVMKFLLKSGTFGPWNIKK